MSLIWATSYIFLKERKIKIKAVAGIRNTNASCHIYFCEYRNSDPFLPDDL